MGTQNLGCLWAKFDSVKESQAAAFCRDNEVSSLLWRALLEFDAESISSLHHNVFTGFLASGDVVESEQSEL